MTIQKNGTVKISSKQANQIIGALFASAEYFENKGSNILAEDDKQLARELWNLLDSIGYYDDVK